MLLQLLDEGNITWVDDERGLEAVHEGEGSDHIQKREATRLGQCSAEFFVKCHVQKVCGAAG